MRIEIAGNGHVLAGTPKQVLMQMKSLTVGAGRMTLREFIERNIARIAHDANVQVELAGQTDDELAESFLNQMLDRGYARSV